MKLSRKKLAGGVLAALTGITAMQATQAVYVDPDNVGQVLVFPYYTVRNDNAGNAYNTLISVMNTSADAKAVKVRILEGMNSREVLDFNIYLSPFDVWVASIRATATGAEIISPEDRTCIAPRQLTTGASFRNALLNEGGGIPSGTDRTREGHIEMIEMGTIIAGTATFNNINHTNGVAGNCAALVTADTTGAVANDINFTYTDDGSLSGNATIINVQSGTEYSYDAIALDSWRAIGSTNVWSFAGSTLPSLEQVDPISEVFFRGQAVVTDWSASPLAIDAVSAVFMHTNVMNEYILETSTNSGTDWVITMPTKRFHVLSGLSVDQRAPFTNVFAGPNGSCEDISITAYDRDEVSTVITDFSPPITVGTALCWEANVLTFNNSNILGSTLVANLDVEHENGWANVGFTGTSAVNFGLDSFIDEQYFGLPVAGFMAHDYVNGTLTVNGQNVLSVYGGSFEHKYQSNIVP